MIAVIQRYKPYFVILTLLMIALMAWLIISKLNTPKIPARGVFVMERVIE